MRTYFVVFPLLLLWHPHSVPIPIYPNVFVVDYWIIVPTSMANIVLTLSYIALFTLWGLSNFILIPVSVNLIITSTLILYIGSHRSLRLLISGPLPTFLII